MNLETEIINRKWAASTKGWRPLDENETRDSSIGHAPCKLFDDKIYPSPDPKTVPAQFYKDEETGIIMVEGAAALSGSVDHGEIQDLVKDIIQSYEATTKATHGKVKTSGHVDMEYNDDARGDVLVDIKTVNQNIFMYCCGASVPKGGKDTYSMKKRHMSINQANHYAIKRGKSKFGILWTIRGEMGKFKLEWFDVDEEMERRNIQKLVDVENARRRYAAGDKTAFPPMPDDCVCECDYCRHSASYFVRDLYNKPTNIPKWDKSPANCPGEEALRERLKHGMKIKQGVVG